MGLRRSVIMAYTLLVPPSFVVTRRLPRRRIPRSPLLTQRMGVRDVTRVCTRAEVGWVTTPDALAEARSTLPFPSQLGCPPQSLTHRRVWAHRHPQRRWPVCLRPPRYHHQSRLDCRWGYLYPRRRLILRRLVTRPCRHHRDHHLCGRVRRLSKLCRLTLLRLSRTFPKTNRCRPRIKYYPLPGPMPAQRYH
jgi:hypothetical protein